MPEQAEAEEAAADHGLKSERRHLQQHDDQPAQPHGHMQSVSTHQGEERREKGAAGRSGSYAKHMAELAQFQTQKRNTENEGDRHPEIRRGPVAALHGEGAET